MSLDPRYDPACDLFLGIDEGYYPGPNVTLWIQPNRKNELVTVLYAHYQWLRTNEENAKIALRVHQERGYGPLTGGWSDPSAPQMARAYSQVFGVEVGAVRRSVEWGEEMLNRWLATAVRFKGTKGLVFSRDCHQKFYYPRDKKEGKEGRWLSLIKEVKEKERHEPGKGAHHGPDGLRYFYAGWAGRIHLF